MNSNHERQKTCSSFRSSTKSQSFQRRSSPRSRSSVIRRASKFREAATRIRTIALLQIESSSCRFILLPMQPIDLRRRGQYQLIVQFKGAYRVGRKAWLMTANGTWTEPLLFPIPVSLQKCHPASSSRPVCPPTHLSATKSERSKNWMKNLTVRT